MCTLDIFQAVAVSYCDSRMFILSHHIAWADNISVTCFMFSYTIINQHHNFHVHYQVSYGSTSTLIYVHIPLFLDTTGWHFHNFHSASLPKNKNGKIKHLFIKYSCIFTRMIAIYASSTERLIALI